MEKRKIIVKNRKYYTIIWLINKNEIDKIFNEIIIKRWWTNEEVWTYYVYDWAIVDYIKFKRIYSKKRFGSFFVMIVWIIDKCEDKFCKIYKDVKRNYRKMRRKIYDY